MTLFSCEREQHHKFYFDSGELQNEFTTINGLKEGESITYFTNGKVRFIKRYKNDKLHGVSELYRENGDLEVKSKFNNSNLIFDKVYDEKGELVVHANALRQEMYNRFNDFFQIAYTHKDSVSEEHYGLDSILLYTNQDSTVIYKFYAPEFSDLGLFVDVTTGKQDSLEFYKFRKFVKSLNSKQPHNNG